MPWLDGGERAMMMALDHGPAHLPDNLFSGSRERVLAGMKVHANTISHARLVALEETFVRTRAVIGHDAFNRLSRLFLEQPGVTGQPLAMIGTGFDAFLAGQGEAVGAAGLARFEWLWLEAYHAADAEPLALTALAGHAPEALLEVTLAAHPSARAEPLAPPVRALLASDVPELEHAEAVLLVRPHAEVLISAASLEMVRILALAHNPQTIGNLLALTGEHPGDEEQQADANMQALVALINAGALVRA
ncbi:putative DNA-binding domain-containing protein [Erythrobacter dokdonensis]|uniref:DUF2063 domain-containing protein n=1 Tax=Erythrobacter dokdonensis DSW-74 TaxID=1300349 RepID=A0A1A7BKE7_9SPHN|nr:putative DNA-binding domain-containing protein [Erythrobacter dokdonensis]OBV11957.1 DUF2063 domain-containing protein [Erythrobacter dokdonensis DSW-74]